MHQELHFSRVLPGKFDRSRIPAISEIQKHHVEGALCKLELIAEKITLSKSCIKVAKIIWWICLALLILNIFRKYHSRRMFQNNQQIETGSYNPSQDRGDQGSGRILQNQHPGRKPDPREPNRPERPERPGNAGTRPPKQGGVPPPPAVGPVRNDPSKPQGDPRPKSEQFSGPFRYDQDLGDSGPRYDNGPEFVNRWMKLNKLCLLFLPLAIIFWKRRSRKVALATSTKLLEIENRYLIPYFRMKMEMRELETLVVTVIQDHNPHPGYQAHLLGGEGVPLREQPRHLSDPNTSFDI